MANEIDTTNPVTVTSILTSEFVVAADAVANRLVDEAQAARDKGDSTALSTRADIIVGIAQELNVSYLVPYDKNGELDTLKAGTYYDTLKCLGCFTGLEPVKGRYGGIQRSTVRAERKVQKAVKAVAEAKEAANKGGTPLTPDQYIEFVV